VTPGRITLVVADDQELVRAGLVSLLHGTEGLEVVGEARDGRAALEAVRAHRPDVALLDVRMPVLDGIEVIRQVRSEAGLSGVRTVVLTTFGLDEYVYDALRAGADGFLVKDIEPDELVRALQRVVSGNAVIAPEVTRLLVEDFLRRQPGTRRTAPELTAREGSILDGVCRGLSNREIARALVIGEATVKSYVSRLLEKFGVTSRVGLVIAAYEAGLVSPG